MPSIAGPAELPEGTRLLDRYVIIDRVAGGGMASIYRATDERLQRIVCVKLLRLVLEAGSTSGSSVYQATYSHFLQEALALSRLHHPNTLKIFDFGYLDESGRPFQISEFLDAGNLEQLVKRSGPIQPTELPSILVPIGGAIAEAHEAGIIHRDIKPSNILFARVGRGLIPKLADFGIAHSSKFRRQNSGEEEDQDPVSVVTLFSPRWAAPEQLAGDASVPSTDVYSFALVTAFMLAGRGMFEGPQVRATFPDRVMGNDLVTRRIGEMGIPPRLVAPLLRGLSARIADRTPSIAQFVQEMRAAIDVRGESAGVQPARPPLDSTNTPPGDTARRRMPSETTETPLSARIHPDAVVEDAGPVAEEIVTGKRRTRIVDVEDRLDLAVPTPLGVDARVRLTLLPSRSGYQLNVKGLNCFIVRGGRPSAAVVVDSDGVVELMSSSREPMGRLGYAFGAIQGGGRVFPAVAPDLMLPLPRGARAVVFEVEATGELIAMCAKRR